MSKPISNAAFKKMIKSMTAEKQQESISRHLRVLPDMIIAESAKLPPHYNPKVVKHLEKRYMTVCKLWTEFLIQKHANKETV